MKRAAYLVSALHAVAVAVLFLLPGEICQAAAQTTRRQAPDKPEERLSKSLSALHRYQPADTDTNAAPRIPQGIRRELAAAKRSLRELVIEELGRAGENADAASVQAASLKRLHAAGIRVWNEREAQQEEDFCPSGLGCVDGLRVSAPQGVKGPIAFLTSLGIPCGEDQSVYVAERGTSGWRVRLADESSDYATIEGAQEGAQFTLLASPKPAAWALVIVSYRPMCASTWRPARLRVLRPGADVFHPAVEMKDERTVYVGVDHPFDLKVTAGHIEVTAAGENRINPEDAYQTYIYSFHREPTRWRRVQPVALTADGFVDEWIFSPWTLAQEWVDRDALAKLKFWHGKLQRLNVQNDDGYEVGAEVTALQACDARETLWQVGITFDDPKRLLPEDLTFVVRKDGEKFFLQGVHLDPPPGCPATAVAQNSTPRYVVSGR